MRKHKNPWKLLDLATFQNPKAFISYWSKCHMILFLVQAGLVTTLCRFSLVASSRGLVAPVCTSVSCLCDLLCLVFILDWNSCGFVYTGELEDLRNPLSSRSSDLRVRVWINLWRPRAYLCVKSEDCLVCGDDDESAVFCRSRKWWSGETREGDEDERRLLHIPSRWPSLPFPLKSLRSILGEDGF